MCVSRELICSTEIGVVQAVLPAALTERQGEHQWPGRKVLQEGIVHSQPWMEYANVASPQVR